MTLPLWIAVVVAAACIGTVLCMLGHTRFLRHLDNIAYEKAVGHHQLRNKMNYYAGRTRETVEQVVPAETMWGWVWISVSRRAPDPYVRATGWAPTRWLARRSLSRRRDGGRASLVTILVVLIAVGLVVDPQFTVHTVRSAFHTIVDLGRQVWTYLHTS